MVVAAMAIAAAEAAAAPAYVKSTVNLRAGPGTGHEIIAKIPEGSLIDAANCDTWWEIEWQDKKGFAIARAIDTSGRVPLRRSPRRAYRAYDDDDLDPPGYFYGPLGYYYGDPRYPWPQPYWGYRH